MNFLNSLFYYTAPHFHIAVTFWTIFCEESFVLFSHNTKSGSILAITSSTGHVDNCNIDYGHPVCMKMCLCSWKIINNIIKWNMKNNVLHALDEYSGFVIIVHMLWDSIILTTFFFENINRLLVYLCITVQR